MMPIRTPLPHDAPDPSGAAGDYTLRSRSVVATSGPINRIVVEWSAQPRRVPSSTAGDGVGSARPTDSPPSDGAASGAITLVVTLVEHQSGGNCLRLHVVTSDHDYEEHSESPSRPAFGIKTDDDEELAIYAPLVPGGSSPSPGRSWKRRELAQWLSTTVGAPPHDIRSHRGPRQARWAAGTSRRRWAPVAVGAVFAVLVGVAVLTTPPDTGAAEVSPTVPSSTSVAPPSGAVITPTSPHSSTSSSTSCRLLPASGWIAALQAPSFSPADCLDTPSSDCTTMEFRTKARPDPPAEQTG
jgi:hypothetical protein